MIELIKDALAEYKRSKFAAIFGLVAVVMAFVLFELETMFIVAGVVLLFVLGMILWDRHIIKTEEVEAQAKLDRVPPYTPGNDTAVTDGDYEEF